MLGYAEDCVQSAERGALDHTILNSPVPQTPGDKPPGEKTYPARPALKPTPEPVPDPAKTETVEQVLKTSLPDYGEPKEFLQAIGQTIRASEKLFEAETETDQDKADKEHLRDDVFSWLNETRQSVYDL
jgi:hypothetical protein